jgi:hypothetical protein
MTTLSLDLNIDELRALATALDFDIADLQSEPADECTALFLGRRLALRERLGAMLRAADGGVVHC